MVEDKIKIFTSDNWEKEIKRSDGLTIVFFWTEWCEPCLEMMSEIKKLAKECSWKINIGTLNVDENDEIASDYKVSIVPTTMLFRDGRKFREIITNVPVDKIIEAIDEV